VDLPKVGIFHQSKQGANFSSTSHILFGGLTRYGRGRKVSPPCLPGQPANVFFLSVVGWDPPPPAPPGEPPRGGERVYEKSLNQIFWPLNNQPRYLFLLKRQVEKLCSRFPPPHSSFAVLFLAFSFFSSPQEIWKPHGEGEPL